MNKRVLITGASRGIGKAIAKQLIEDGFEVVIHYNSNIEKATETASQLSKDGITPQIISFNIGDREQCKEVIEKDMEENAVYFGVVCNAGICADAAFPAMTGEQWDNVIHTNLDGFYNVLQPIIMPLVRTRVKGRIVTLSSVSGIMGNRGQVNYAASKAGIIGATKSLAMEMAKRGITVNCVAPGIIDTDMTDGLDKDVIKQIVPMRRSGTSEEVANTVSFLFSDKASYITRQVISVNGGMI
jgi:3-oxoacyl-[acyl-carrier protein] reductase